MNHEFMNQKENFKDQRSLRALAFSIIELKQELISLEMARKSYNLRLKKKHEVH